MSNNKCCNIFSNKLPKGNNGDYCAACWMSGRIEIEASECGKYCYAVKPAGKK